MRLDIHGPRFTWSGTPGSIGPTLTSLAQTAETMGGRTLPVMDHWFPMDVMGPADEPVLMAGWTGAEPSRWLEAVWGPVVPRLEGVGPA